MVDSSCSTMFHDPFHPPIRFVFKTAALDSKLAITSGVCLIIKFLHYDVDTERYRLWHTWQYPAGRCSSRGYKHSDSAFVSVKEMHISLNSEARATIFGHFIQQYKLRSYAVH